jgi:hypothetical protein
MRLTARSTNTPNEKEKRTVITVEGIRVKAKAIPEKRLAEGWKTLTNEPFPKVKAFQLNDDDFNRIIQLRRCAEDEEREMIEWGRVLTTTGTDACVLTGTEHVDVDYIILIRKNPYHSLKEIIRHELSHIAKRDL